MGRYSPDREYPALGFDPVDHLCVLAHRQTCGAIVRAIRHVGRFRRDPECRNLGAELIERWRDQYVIYLMFGLNADC